MSPVQTLSLVFAFTVGACISYALYAFLSIWLVWWLALIAAFVAQPLLVGGFEALFPGRIEQGCTAAASGVLGALRSVRGLFAKA